MSRASGRISSTCPTGTPFPPTTPSARRLTTRNMYRFKHRDAVLERLENHGRKETVALASYTVDHIMPQGERLRPRRPPELPDCTAPRQPASGRIRPSLLHSRPGAGRPHPRRTSHHQPSHTGRLSTTA